VLAVESIRSVNGSGKIEAGIRYFLSRCCDDLTVLVQAVRRHWTMENGLHWVLDVMFREDGSRRLGPDGGPQSGHPAQNRHQPHEP
jgi:predicted transposase YbfD/YdcC